MLREGSTTDPGHGLVLQGGGALGSFELGVARAVYSESSRFCPGAIAGVSIGAISTVLLGRPAQGYTPLRALETFWQRVTTSSLLPPSLQPYASLAGVPNFYWLSPLSMFGTSLYSVEPLRKTLLELVDIEKLADPSAQPRLVLTATDILKGQLQSFVSTAGGLSLDHVLASGSLPPSFPMTTIDDTAYWDGGLFDNTPLGALIDLLEGENRAVLVVNLFPNRVEQLPSTMAEVGQRCLNLLFANKTHSDVKLMTRFNAVAGLMEELARLPDDSPIKASKAYADVLEEGYKTVPAIVEVTRTTPAASLEASDFSHGGIERRADEGRAEAMAQLGKKGFWSSPATSAPTR